MIKFSLHCENDHEFEGWFASSDEFEKNVKRGFLACPHCNSTKVEKSLMAPSVSTGRKKDQMVQVATQAAVQKEMVKKIKEIREHVFKNAENVGEKFSEEARKIHYGEADERGIYGKATLAEAVELHEEGIAVAPIPELPEDKN